MNIRELIGKARKFESEKLEILRAKGYEVIGYVGRRVMRNS